MVAKAGTRKRKTCLLDMFPSFVSCVLMGKPFHPNEHDFKIRKLREIISTYSMGVLRGPNKKMKVT